MKIRLQNTYEKFTAGFTFKTSDLLFGFFLLQRQSTFIESCSYRLSLDSLKLEIALICVSFLWTLIIIFDLELT